MNFYEKKLLLPISDYYKLYVEILRDNLSFPLSDYNNKEC